MRKLTATAILICSVTAAEVPGYAGSIVIGMLSGNAQAYNAPTGTAEGQFGTQNTTLSATTAINGDILMADFSGHINDFSATGVSMGALISNGLTNQGLAVAPDGTIYSTANGDQILKYSSAGVAEGQFAGGGFAFDDVSVASNGNVVGLDFNDVKVFNSSGTILHQFFLPQGYNFGVTVGANGDIFVGSAGQLYSNQTGEIYVCRGCATGTVGSFVQLGSFTTTDSFGHLLVDGSTLYAAGRFDNDVLAFDTTTGAEHTFASSLQSGPYALALTSSDGPFGPSGTPEPASFILLGGGLLLCGALRTRAGRRTR